MNCMIKSDSYKAGRQTASNFCAFPQFIKSCVLHRFSYSMDLHIQVKPMTQQYVAYVNFCLWKTLDFLCCMGLVYIWLWKNN